MDRPDSQGRSDEGPDAWGEGRSRPAAPLPDIHASGASVSGASAAGSSVVEGDGGEISGRLEGAAAQRQALLDAASVLVFRLDPVTGGILHLGQ